MRLWHEYLIPYLDNKRLIGQHRECCALRGKGWGRKHSVVNYVFEHHIAKLIQYHTLVMNECGWRGYKIDNLWYEFWYRGKNMTRFNQNEMNANIYITNMTVTGECITENDYGSTTKFIYPEHNPEYLMECLVNLQSKNAQLVNGMSLEELILKLQIIGV